MRPITRQSARLANNCSHIRSSSLPRQRIARHRRPFHTSVHRSSEPRPPSGTDHDASLNGRREPQRGHENDSQQHEPVAEQGSEEVKPANEVRKSGPRRTLRQRRMNEVPKPPPIPEWFLKHNVSLIEDSPGVGVSKDKVQAIRCIDTETGHTLFSVPYYQPEEPTKPEEHSEGTPRTNKHSSEHPQDRPDIQSATHQEEIVRKYKEAKKALDPSFFDPKFQTVEDDKNHGVQRSQEADRSHSKVFTPPTKSDGAVNGMEWNMDPMRWLFLEAETTARAALSLANDNQRLSSFAADRVDLSVQCHDSDSHARMDEFAQDVARIVGADVIQLDANDFAELTDEYVGQGEDGPGAFSNLGYDVFAGYETNALDHNLGAFQSQVDESEENDPDEDEEDEDDEHDNASGRGFGHMLNLGQLTKALQAGGLGKALRGRIVGVGFGGPPGDRLNRVGPQASRPSMGSAQTEVNRDDARLDALFDNLLDAPKQKRATNKDTDAASEARRREVVKPLSGGWQDMLRHSRANASPWLPDTSKLLLMHLGSKIQGDDPTRFPYQLVSDAVAPADAVTPVPDAPPKTIVHIRDLQDVWSSRLGETVIRRLSKVVRKRRRSGEQIVIIGTTAQDVPGPTLMPGEHLDNFPFRTITLPPFFNFTHIDDAAFDVGSPRLEGKSLSESEYSRILEINLRHLQTMSRRLSPQSDVDLSSVKARKQLDMPGMHFITERVLPLDQVQRLALMAVGLSQLHAKADAVQPIHLALAAYVTIRSDHVVRSWSSFKNKKQGKPSKSDSMGNDNANKSEGESGGARIERIKKTCNQHETRLLTGVVDATQIKTRFEDVHAPTETIDALKTLTSLSLLRPEAFKYGVLASDRLPGLLLYGPPGTGKTLLAKAVAKESKATVLEVSGAQIYEKYVGEGEKMVRAVFSLAKKLSPCIVFIDEADAIFGSRSNAGNRNTHREIINQFLREWDGMDDHGVFMMVASNRPFDLDDAVLRRLPRRLLVDLPVAKDRESILGIHLRNEALDNSVSLAKLAEQTPLYSGSDLKNLSVAAALACVREENELAESKKDDKEFKLPDRRTLTSKHFEKALAEISASISEDMSSLTAVRKFDEQYGDRKGRRKKTGYGFGAVDGVVDKSAARVRQASSQPPPPP
ncbi:hypothetical protein LTR37_018386 [Vermiconidia calcicola]|uniref:Uncharacterized protein n=1 Tax=Vermiconidia calcicola TaxID=1690605 RepID=A0ACC3MHE6_9PEZI|nr:hypothetical protein LTR37_018386 [Vermiconidia calcicola]